MRPHPSIRFWGGDVREILPGVTLICVGGRFPGGTVLHWAERGQACSRPGTSCKWGRKAQACENGRGLNQGNTQNEKSLYPQSSIDFPCYLEMAFFRAHQHS